MQLNIGDIAKFLHDLDLETEIRSAAKFDYSWFSTSLPGQKFYELLVMWRIDLQSKMAEYTFETQYDKEAYLKLKGGYDQLGDLIEVLNVLVGRGQTDEEGITGDG